MFFELIYEYNNNSMKHLLNIFLIISFTAISFQVRGQLSLYIDKSEAIIECEALDSECINENGIIETITKFRINYVYKGIVNDSILLINTMGGEKDGEIHYVLHEKSFNEGDKYILFMEEHTIEQDVRYTLSRKMAIIKGSLKPVVFFSGKKYSYNQFENKIYDFTEYPKLKPDHFLQRKHISSPEPCGIINTPTQLDIEFNNINVSQNLQNLNFDIACRMNHPGIVLGDANIYIEFDESFENLTHPDSININPNGEILDSYTINKELIDDNHLLISMTYNEGEEPYHLPTEFTPLLNCDISIDPANILGIVQFSNINATGNVNMYCYQQQEPIDSVNFGVAITHTSSQVPISLKYTMDNFALLENETKLAFDIFAEAGSQTLFSDGEIIIEYNPEGFNDFVVAGNNFQFIRGELIEDVNTYPIDFFDYPENGHLDIIISGASTFSTQYTKLSTEKKKVGTVILEISDCSLNKEISFDSEMNNPDIFSGHYISTPPNPYIRYEPIIANQTENGRICGCEKPVITSFSTPYAPELKIHAGSGEILTIVGENFGNAADTEKAIIFRNGDEDNEDEMKTHKADFEWDNNIHWSDTEIKVKVPSTDFTSGFSKTAATGTFKVQNSCDISDPSDETLQIPYSLMTRRTGSFTGDLQDVALRESHDKGICFNFSTQLPNWIKIEFETALNQWCSFTGINFLIGSSINKNTVQKDGINLVSIQNSGGVDGAMSVSTGLLATCPTATSSTVVFNDIDIFVTTNVTNPSNSERERMRQILTHELGHAHMLQHARSGGTMVNQYLMHPNGNLNGIITPNDSEGANLVFQRSQNLVEGICGKAIGNTNCGMMCGTTSNDNIVKYSSYSITPNPTNSYLDIELIGDEIEDALIIIYDNSGRQILTKKIGDIISKYRLNLPDNLNGTYFVNLIHKHGYFVKRVLVLN